MGDTGSGKSTLLARLLESQPDYIVLRTKPDDVKWDGKVVRKASDIDDPRVYHYILEPKYDAQWREARQMFEDTFKEKGWTVCVDELWYVIQQLRLEQPVNRAFTQGRSKKLTFVCGMQRPVHVTRFALSQSSHVIVFQQDGRDAVTIGDAAGGRPFAQLIMSLQRHEFLWYYRPLRQIWRGKLNMRSGALEGAIVP